jgi:hypothetical protein
MDNQPPKPKPQAGVPPPRPPRHTAVGLAADDPDGGSKRYSKKEIVRINLPPKPSAALTIKLPVIPSAVPPREKHGMEKWLAIIAVIACGFFIVSDIVRDFINDDPVQYFMAKPKRLLLVAAIAIVGGLLTLIYDNLSPRSKRRVKLFALGLAAGCMTLFIGYLAFVMHALRPFSGSYSFALIPLCLCACAVTLWLEFYRSFKSREK